MTWPVTWPESLSEASTTTCGATSSGCATFFRALVRGPHAGHRGADGELTRLPEQPLRLALVGEVGTDRARTAELRGQRFGPRATEVVVDDHFAALRRECPRARASDPARGPRHEYAFPRETGLHEPGL